MPAEASYLDHQRRRKWARRKTAGLKAWRRDLAVFVQAGFLAAVALWQFGSSDDAAMDELIVAGAAVSAVLLRVPLEFAWNYLRAPRHLLAEELAEIRLAMSAQTGSVDEQARHAMVTLDEIRAEALAQARVVAGEQAFVEARERMRLEQDARFRGALNRIDAEFDDLADLVQQALSQGAGTGKWNGAQFRHRIVLAPVATDVELLAAHEDFEQLGRAARVVVRLATRVTSCAQLIMRNMVDPAMREDCGPILEELDAALKAAEPLQQAARARLAELKAGERI